MYEGQGTKFQSLALEKESLLWIKDLRKIDTILLCSYKRHCSAINELKQIKLTVYQMENIQKILSMFFAILKLV